MQHLIYGLFDPSDDARTIRYVGYTRRTIGRRLTAHIVTAKQRSCHRHNWIMKILDAGQRPGVIVIEEVTAENWQERERFWIASLSGNDLVNGTAGGEGLVNPSPETRAKISAGNKGKKVAREVVERIAAANRGRVPTAEHREKIARAHLGRVFTDETRTKMSASRIGLRPSDETRAKMSASQKGRVHSPEARAKMSASNIGKNLGKRLSDEAKAHLSAVNKGKVTSPETKAKMSEAARRRWAARRAA